MKQRLLPIAVCGLLLLAGCQEEIWELEEEDIVTFSDGEAVDCWRGYQDGLREGHVCYKLSDGTILLIEDDLAGPAGDAGFAGLSEEVQAAVTAWYNGEGRRYDLSALLEEAYARFQAGEAETFEAGRVSQYIASTAQSEKVIYFTTTVDQAADPANGVSLRYSAAFERETGQRLELWSLFSRPEAEVRLALVAAAGDDPVVQETLAAAIDSQKVLFYEEHLEIEFPAGTLEGLDTSYTLAVDYTALDGQLESWAIPGGGS